MKVNIAIDGPAGSGKTTLGRELAQRVNYQFLDSGLFYRYFAKMCTYSPVKLHFFSQTRHIFVLIWPADYGQGFYLSFSGLWAST